MAQRRNGVKTQGTGHNEERIEPSHGVAIIIQKAKPGQKFFPVSSLLKN